MSEKSHAISGSSFRHPVITIARANFNTWLHSPRTLFMMFFILALCYMQATGFQMIQSRLPYTMHWGESCFYELSVGVNISMSSILFLVTIHELPQRISFQTASLIRSTRMKWLLAQILYCLAMAFMMILLVAVFLSIFLLATVPTGGGWSETQALIDGQISEDMALVPQYVRENFTPLAASILACVPLLFFWFTMALVVLLCSLIGLPLLGILLYVFLLMANIIIYVEFFPWLAVPVQYATLRVFFTARDVKLYMLKALLIYLVTDAALIAGMILRTKKNDLCF